MIRLPHSRLQRGERLEKDVREWRHLSSSDLDSSVDEELERLVAQMREAHHAAQEASKAISLDLKSLENRKVEILDAMDASNSALLDANLLLSKIELVRLEEITRLEQLKAQNDDVLQREIAQRATLAEIEASLSQTPNFNEAELRSQAFIRVAEERKNNPATLEERIKSYESPS